MTELSKKPPKRHQKPANSPDWVEAHRHSVVRLAADLREAHRYSSYHRAEVLTSARCGCCYCGTTFPPLDIEDWIDEKEGEGQTARSPRCGTDAVLGDRAGFQLSSAFLERMKSSWF